jgi:hypothetical protein
MTDNGVEVKVRRAHSFNADINGSVCHEDQLTHIKNVKMLSLFGLGAFVLMTPRR